MLVATSADRWGRKNLNHTLNKKKKRWKEGKQSDNGGLEVTQMEQTMGGGRDQRQIKGPVYELDQHEAADPPTHARMIKKQQPELYDACGL